MNINLIKITVRELTNGYEDKEEAGVRGYAGKLDIRPPYQREFIYKPKQRDAVIDTLTKKFPLNVMYWAVRDDGNFEIIDGQQRTISICRYVKGDFSFKNLYFENLPSNKQEEILNYELQVYQCSGTPSERLEWFRTINIAGEPLTDQELRNAVYAGSWITDAKRYFSKRDCAAYRIAKDYLNGSADRQDYLEKAIDWIVAPDTNCKKEEDPISCYMSKHQHDPIAIDLWNYFQSVVSWVDANFTVKRKFMKGVDWGILYNEFKDKKYIPKDIEIETAKLIADDEVENKKGIYPFILTRDEKYLSIRVFTDSMKQKVYEKQKGICPHCKKEGKEKDHWELAEMEGDHITPWRDKGKTTEENCQMLCKDHNRRKSGK